MSLFERLVVIAPAGGSAEPRGRVTDDGRRHVVTVVRIW
jgi:hypothetical protein